MEQTVSFSVSGTERKDALEKIGVMSSILLVDTEPVDFFELVREQDNFLLVGKYQREQSYTLQDLHSIVTFLEVATELSGDGVKVSWQKKFTPDSTPLYWDKQLGRASEVPVESGSEPRMYAQVEVFPKKQPASKDNLNLKNKIADLLQDNAISEIEAICHDLTQSTISLHWTAEFQTFAFQNPMQQNTVSVLEPHQDRFIIHIKNDMEPQFVAMNILHCVGHILLKHVQLGDRYSHWDTKESVVNGRSQRKWDREVSKHFSHWFEREYTELSDKEKAQLAMLSVMNETLGSHKHQLHSKAKQYQKTKYQVLAAQRIVSLLNEFGGAMLCDGVGLGKTYVGTTVMVHYLNTWIEKEPSEPFRITILSPNSVVSTWRSEAISSMHGFANIDWKQNVRVVSHTRLQGIASGSDILKPQNGISDFEHLMLSDLVIVDEAHNFRSPSAARTKALRALLRIQPRKYKNPKERRRVLLLTATPINNTIEDFRQQLSLMFSEEKYLGFEGSIEPPEEVTKKIRKEIKQRCENARLKKSTNVLPYLLFGKHDEGFSEIFQFKNQRYVTQVDHLDDYLASEAKRLEDFRTAFREDQSIGSISVTTELLNNVVVQRSRTICQQIEATNTDNTDLLFRVPSEDTTPLFYKDEMEGTKDLLAGFLPLFGAEQEDTEEDNPLKLKPLSLKVYMWYDLLEEKKTIEETSSVVGLQKVLILKRLESSPVSFLLTLLRLLALHAHRLQKMMNMALRLNLKDEHTLLKGEVDGLVNALSEETLQQMYQLTIGKSPNNLRHDFISSLSKAYDRKGTIAGTDDKDSSAAFQLELFGVKETNDPSWNNVIPLKDFLLQDLDTLLNVVPRLMDTVFRGITSNEWPKKFIIGGLEGGKKGKSQSIEWPRTKTWAMRFVSDEKLKTLFEKLLDAQTKSQKTIVFSQFGDSIAYIYSVLQAVEDCHLNKQLSDKDWQEILGKFDKAYSQDHVLHMIKRTKAITGSTENRDLWVNRFAPFYRIGPFKPKDDVVIESLSGRTQWEEDWLDAIKNPIDTLITSDILAEGVNLQDATVLINFDLHWNPVKMIQRAGRIDRRLKRAIETPQVFADLKVLCDANNLKTPQYYWHHREDESPMICNLLLPDVLEEKLLLRERIALKTISIDVTLGLEQGTGAEADWMQDYKYQGVQSLNRNTQDRPIEVLDGNRTALLTHLQVRGVTPTKILNTNDQDKIFRNWFLVGEHRERSMFANVTYPNEADGHNRRLLRPYIEDNQEWVFCGSDNYQQMHLSYQANWFPLYEVGYPQMLPSNTHAVTKASQEVLIEDMNRLIVRLNDAETVKEVDLQDIGKNGLENIHALVKWGFAATGGKFSTDSEQELWFADVLEYKILLFDF